MAADDWYRNKVWNAKIEAAFDQNLERTRSQKAQYLRIQGSILRATHPEDAIRLLKRCIDVGESFEVAHALLDIAHAQLIQGETDAALITLEAVIEQEKSQPRFRTTAAYDYPFLVAVFGKKERYEKALEMLQGLGEGLFESMKFEADAARALILEDLGEHATAQKAAQRALESASVEAGWVPRYPEVGLVPNGGYPLSERLRIIAAAD